MPTVDEMIARFERSTPEFKAKQNQIQREALVKNFNAAKEQIKLIDQKIARLQKEKANLIEKNKNRKEYWQKKYGE